MQRYRLITPIVATIVSNDKQLACIIPSGAVVEAPALDPNTSNWMQLIRGEWQGAEVTVFVRDLLQYGEEVKDAP